MIALISILIPAYECYWLGVWPSLAPEKIMVVDDGSTDGTLAGRRNLSRVKFRW